MCNVPVSLTTSYDLVYQRQQKNLKISIYLSIYLGENLEILYDISHTSFTTEMEPIKSINVSCTEIKPEGRDVR